MRRNVLLVDLAIAIVAAIVVLAVTPGLAVAAMIAILVLAGCALSMGRESRRRARDPRRRSRRRAGRAGP